MASITNPGVTPADPSVSPKYFRTGGSGFTVFWWDGHPIGFAQAVGHTAPQPVAAPIAAQPMDQQYPMQIITPAAQGPGTLQLEMFELFNEKIWDTLMLVTDTNTRSQDGFQAGSIYHDLTQIFLRLAAIGRPISCYKLIYPPYVGVRGGNPNAKPIYADQYFNCAITDIRDDERIEIGTITVIKNLTIQYTYSRRHFNFKKA